MAGPGIDSQLQQASDGLLGRITAILDAAREHVVRTVNQATVSVYWHIGREIVEAVQQGDERAAYGKTLVENLARRLSERYGKGFSATNLWYFRQFYLTYRERIPQPPGGESRSLEAEILHPAGGESSPGFHPNLSWSHYRALMKVDDAIGELTHQDIGQMDGYVQLYEDHHKLDGDNPTIGLILCSEKNEAVARYSVLHESRQLFASRYRFTLPTEEELQRELERERALIETQMASDA
ncbi:MAG TPA: PDDEXK nuclease domain-containing protein [Albitalea sp.]|nr:PDDEXK nuclease domain-containing protein [Albitalea sp.]